MKKFVVDFGRGLIDFSAWIVLTVIILVGLFLFTTEPLAAFFEIIIFQRYFEPGLQPFLRYSIGPVCIKST